jgi:transcriptional regulator with XRE-family HTH domain
MPATNPIRDLRESKQLSQDAVAEAAGLTYSKFVRIEEGSGKTTPEEVAHVLAVLEKMTPSARKLAGRPFKDPAKQAAVQKARESGQSVAEALGYTVPGGEVAPPAKKATRKRATPAKKATATRKPTANLAGALGKTRTRKPKA